jgi:ABC-type microcin C transport system permease subunit YejE
MFSVKHLHLYKSRWALYTYMEFKYYTIYMHDNEIVPSFPSFDVELKSMDFAYYFLGPMEVTLWIFPIHHAILAP